MYSKEAQKNIYFKFKIAHIRLKRLKIGILLAYFKKWLIIILWAL